jgi:ferrous iron transport protein B
MAFIVSGGIAGGCAVPGVMATRTLKSPRERLATLLTVPFMNCGAKLPVFALLVAAFFAEKEALVMLVITLVSWCGALLIARLLRSTVIRGGATPFVMELPPYRLPTFRGLMIHTWERTWQYMKKAGTVILGISVILWAMMTFPGLPEEERARLEAQRQSLLTTADPESAAQIETPSATNPAPSPELAELKARLSALERQRSEMTLRGSLAGRLGAALEPVSRWAGFDWQTNIALLGGFAAKEVIVSTLGTAYSMSQTQAQEGRPLSAKLAANPAWSPVTAISLMVFTIFYAPCFVTVVCIVRESGSWKWGVFSMAFNTALAFSLATVVYQLGSIWS